MPSGQRASSHKKGVAATRASKAVSKARGAATRRLLRTGDRVVKEFLHSNPDHLYLAEVKRSLGGNRVEVTKQDGTTANLLLAGSLRLPGKVHRRNNVLSASEGRIVLCNEDEVRAVVPPSELRNVGWKKRSGNSNRNSAYTIGEEEDESRSRSRSRSK
jgi:hypothetical protein